MDDDEEKKTTVTGRIVGSQPSLMGLAIASNLAALAALDFTSIEDRIFSFNETLEVGPEQFDYIRRMTGGSRHTPVRAGKRYSYEEPPPPPNPKADKRKANRVKQMQERRARRKALGGKNVPR